MDRGVAADEMRAAPGGDAGAREAGPGADGRRLTRSGDPAPRGPAHVRRCVDFRFRLLKKQQHLVSSVTSTSAGAVMGALE